MPTVCTTIGASPNLIYASSGQKVISGDIRLSNFSLTLGIGSDSSNLDLELYYDPCNGAGSIKPPRIGAATIFSCNSLVFGGIINSATVSESSSGLSYKLKIIDPRKILENVSVILRDYYCPIQPPLPNLINVLSIIEQGVALCPPGDDTHNWPRVGNCGPYGTSGGSIGGSNGISLKKALSAVQSFNTVYTTIGEPLRLNLSKLIALIPEYAKTDGTSSSLLSLISQAADEAACDFTVSLEGTAITIWPINRAIQPRLGLIDQIITQAKSTGTLVSGEVGSEELYENSNRIVLGEKVHYITRSDMSNKATMMLGYLPDGNPVRVDTPNFKANIDVRTLSASLVALGYPGIGDTYTITEEEILCSGSVHYWKLYGALRPNSLSGKLLEILKIKNQLTNVLAAFQKLMAGNEQDFVPHYNRVCQIPNDGVKPNNQQFGALVIYGQCHSWFTNFINDWYGKKWLVPLKPFCVNPSNVNVVGDGGSVLMSDAPTDGGWPTDENLSGLNAQAGETVLFETSDGRLGGFFVLPADISTSRVINGKDVNFILAPDALAGADYLVKNNLIYLKINAQGKIYKRDQGIAEVLVDSPIISMVPKFNNKLLSQGLIAMSTLLGDDTLMTKLQKRDGVTGDISSCNIFKLGSLAAGLKTQLIANIPMKSNLYVYGPWVGSKGSIGSTEVVATNLSPWNYGSYKTMDTVGKALAKNGLRITNKTESGSMTLAEAPGYSLDYFLEGGIVINSIVVNYNSGGVTTSYNFQTYSAKFGQYGKAIADSVQNAVKSRNDILLSIKEQRRKLISSINTARTDFAKNMGKKLDDWKPPSTVQTASPAWVLVGGCINTDDAPYKTYEVGLNTKKEYESATVGPNFSRLAIMSLDGFFSAVSINGRNDYLPRYCTSWGYEKGEESSKTRPSMPPINNWEIDYPFPINQTYLNPILSTSMLSSWDRGASSSTNIMALSFGDNSPEKDIYSPYSSKYDSEDDFGFYCLRGPLVLQAWGYDTENKPIPNAVDTPSRASQGDFENDETQNRFMDDWLAKPDCWPIGPIDLRFDRDRGVWVCPPPDRILLVELEEDLKEKSCAMAKLLNTIAENTDAGISSPFYDNYKIWGPNGEDIITEIEEQKIRVFDYIGVSMKKKDKGYAIRNDDKYLIIPKSENSSIKLCKYEGEWKKNTAKTVNPYKVNPDSKTDHKTNPLYGNLTGDPDYEPVKALNLLQTVKPKADGNNETFCIIADIGSKFHVVIAFGSGCDDGIDAGLLHKDADADSDATPLSEGDKMEVLVNDKGCVKWWKVKEWDVFINATLETDKLSFEREKVFVLTGAKPDPVDIDLVECPRPTGSGSGSG